MNEIITAIRDRRSCRKFKADMPSSADLDQIVEAGLYAASGRGRQASIVLKVTNKELRDRLSAMNARIWGKPGDIDPFFGAPAILVVLADRTVPTYVYDGSLTMGNMMLAAESLGLASIFIPEKTAAVTIQAKNVKMNLTPTSYGRGSAGFGAVGTF